MNRTLGASLRPPLPRVHGGVRSGVVVAGAAAVSVLAGAGFAMLDPANSWVFVLALAGILALPIAARVAAGRFDPFEPIVVFVLAYGAMFVVRPIAMLVDGRLAFERSYGSIDVSSTFDQMLVIALVGALGFMGGYSLAAGRQIAKWLRSPPAGRPDRRALAVAALSFAAVGTGFFAVFLVSHGGAAMLELILAGRSTALDEAVRSSSKYLWYSSWLVIPAAFTLLAAGRAARDKVLVGFGVMMVGIVLIRAIPLGSRMMLLPLVLGGIVYVYVARGRRPGVIALALAVSVALLGSTVLLSVRNAQTRESRGLLDAAAATIGDPQHIFEPLVAGDDAAMAPLLAAALLVVPEEVPRLHGRAVVGDLFIRPIPRQLWSGKPLPAREQLIALLWPGNTSLNPEFSILLYPYLDFGLIGILVVLGILGIGARALYEYFRLYSHTFSGAVLYSVALPFLVVAMRDSPADAFMRAAFVVIPTWIILSFATRRTRRVGTR